jgi:hypothetical protein
MEAWIIRRCIAYIGSDVRALRAVIIVRDLLDFIFAQIAAGPPWCAAGRP